MCNRGLQVYQFNVPTFGKGVVFDVDSRIRAEQFKFFASALQSSKLKSYIPLFAKESEVSLDHSLLWLDVEACCYGLMFCGLWLWLDLIRDNAVEVHCSHCQCLKQRCTWEA